MSVTVASLHIHPIKSLGGFAVTEARTTDRGFEHDRRWMLVDEDGVFFTQRETAAMACLHCTLTATGFRVTDIRSGDGADVPWTLNDGEQKTARVWDDVVTVLHAPMELSAWFADQLQRTCSLVYMPDGAQRNVDPTYAQGITSLSDGFPYLLLSQASLDDLNARGVAGADEHMSTWSNVPLDRFRPNIVIAGGTPYQEDGWKEISIGDARLSVVKPCARCVIITTDQTTGERSTEPLRTLAKYRRRAGAEHKVDFGMNAMAKSGDVVRVGDLVRLLTDR